MNRSILLTSKSGINTVCLRSPGFCSQTTDGDLLELNGARKARLSLCCHIGSFITSESCVEATNQTKVQLPTVYDNDLVPMNVTASDQHFIFLVWNPCTGENRYPLTPHIYEDEIWYLLSNGTIYRPLAEEAEDRFLNYRQYCLGRVTDYEYPEYMVFFCEAAGEENGGAVYSYGMLASVPFLIATYLVYCLLPELNNLHGLTLRGYVGCLATAYSMLAVLQLTPQEWIAYGSCIAIGITSAERDLLYVFLIVCCAINARRTRRESFERGRRDETDRRADEINHRLC